jgi:hypothetical protein
MNSPQRLNRRQIPEAVRNREAFTNSTGSLRGMTGNGLGQHLTGYLNDEERKRFLSDAFHGITYLVVSYDTPIAWECKPGDVYKVSQKFSVTTSHHMGLLYYL